MLVQPAVSSVPAGETLATLNIKWLANLSVIVMTMRRRMVIIMAKMVMVIIVMSRMRVARHPLRHCHDQDEDED